MRTLHAARVGRRGIGVERGAEENGRERQRLKKGSNQEIYWTAGISRAFPRHLRLIEERMIVAGVMVIKVNLVC